MKKNNVQWILAGIISFFITTAYYLLPSAALAQITFEKTYGGSLNDLGYFVRQTSDEGYIITGATYSFGSGSDDVYLIKTDSLGDTLWTRTYGDTSEDRGYAVQVTQDKGYIIAGRTSSFGAGSYDVYLIKTDSLGGILWTKTYGFSSGDVGYSVQETRDGGFIVAGCTRCFSNSSDLYLIKTDSLGDTL
jgi:hypothetical protein